MCMEDLRIGYESTSGLRPFAASGADQGVAAPDAKRRSIFFGPPDAGRVTYVPAGTPVTDGRGIVVAAGSQGVTLLLDTHGLIVQQGWRAISAGGATGFAVVTSQLPASFDTNA